MRALAVVLWVSVLGMGCNAERVESDHRCYLAVRSAIDAVDAKMENAASARIASAIAFRNAAADFELSMVLARSTMSTSGGYNGGTPREVGHRDRLLAISRRFVAPDASVDEPLRKTAASVLGACELTSTSSQRNTGR